jgi:hypothetical protein
MATTYYETIQKMYVAYFNRPADYAGQQYWETVIENANGNTTAVSAAFAASTEYQTAYAGMSNGDIVNKIYMNLFGRPAEDAGKSYWANLLDTKQISINSAVTDIANGARTTDLTAYNNKVIAATQFTAQLNTATEQSGYSGDAANAIAKAFLSGVTTDATLISAIAQATLGYTVASSVAAGTAFTLSNGLEALDIATQAKTNFLDAADGKADGTITGGADAVEAKIGTDLSTAVTGVDNLVGGDYTTATPGVRAALLADQQNLNASAVNTAQTALTTANTNIANVAGLNNAMTTLASSTTAAANAVTTATNAQTDVALKLAAYNVLNPTDVSMPAAGSYSIDGVITADANGTLALATGVTETTNPGVTALLNSLTAEKVADANVTTTANAQVAAQGAVDFLDLTAAARTDLAGIAAEMKLPTGTNPTAAQIDAQLKGLQTASADAQAAAAAYPDDAAAQQAAATAQTAYNNFNTMVQKLYADDNANPLIAAQATATTDATMAQKAVTDLSTALSSLSTANMMQTQLDAVNKQLTAAQNTFTTNKLQMPMSLDAAHNAMAATTGSDVYIVANDASKTAAYSATVTNFGVLGADSLAIGTRYTSLVSDLTKGNDAALEAFLTKDATGNAVVTLEQKAFGSSSGTDLVSITLTGVTDLTQVHLSNGIITVA